MSLFGHFSEQTILHVARNFRQLKFPCMVISQNFPARRDFVSLQCLSTRNLGGFSFNCECENTTKFVVVRLEMRLELKFCGSADEVKYFVSKHYQSIYFFSAFTVLLHIVLLEYCTNCRNHCTSLHGLNPQ